ncbi:MAG: hypothetical protein OXG56_08725, partial [Gammaproteobacteria bacterium]|nr:hypothetical protein [Gammaproteobacteria bacterium]
MPRFNDDLFWNEYQHFSDLSKLEAVLGQLDFTSARLTGASVAGASPVWERVNHPPSHEPCVVRRE